MDATARIFRTLQHAEQFDARDGLMFAARKQSGDNVEVVRGEQAPGMGARRMCRFQRAFFRGLGRFQRRRTGGLRSPHKKAQMMVAGQIPEVIQADPSERGYFLFCKDLLA